MNQEMREKHARLSRWIPEDRNQSVAHGVNHVAVCCKDLDETAVVRTISLMWGAPAV